MKGDKVMSEKACMLSIGILVGLFTHQLDGYSTPGTHYDSPIRLGKGIGTGYEGEDDYERTKGKSSCRSGGADIIR